MSWISINDACKALVLSKRSIWRRIGDGSLQSKEENGRRLVLIEPGNNEQAGTKPKTGGERRGISLLTLDLTENLFDLLQEIRERAKTARNLATIFQGFDGEELEQLADIWIEVLKVIEASYKKIQGPGIGNNDELSGLFPKLLRARHEVEALENKKINSLESDDTTEIIEDIKVEKRKRDQLLSIFEETISNLKKMIIASREAEG